MIHLRGHHPLHLLTVATGICASLLGAPVYAGSNAASFPVKVQVDASKSLGPMVPIWRFFGYDEPNYTNMKYGRKLIGELGHLRPGHIYARTHNLLNTGNGEPALKWGSTNVYTLDSSGKPVYNWNILDGIIGTYVRNGVKPYFEFGFMPKALSTHPSPYRHHWHPGAKYDEIYTGWSYPPTSYKKWGNLINHVAQHYVDKYGASQVASWYWETWNEPNIGYWRGTKQQFLKLHDYAIHGVRQALPNARVGGPDTAGGGGKFLRDFLKHCLSGTNYATGQTGTPLDFVSFHAKGKPSFVQGHVRMGMRHQLRVIDDAFKIIASFPQLKQTPIVIGENDPEGCAACQGKSLAYRNGAMYATYTAATFARIYELKRRYHLNLTGALTWAFEFENQPFFAGFRSLATHGIDKPVLNTFRMFSKMTGTELRTSSDHALPLNTILKKGVTTPDVSALASLDHHKLEVMLWHYDRDNVPGPAADVALNLSNLPLKHGTAKIVQYRIDHTYSNAYTRWKRMGSPQKPTTRQYQLLDDHDGLARIGSPRSLDVTAGRATLHVTLPRKSVSLFTITWQ